MKNIVILGSTGSIGTNTLEVIRGLSDHYKVVGLAANTQWELLARQVEEFKPAWVSLADKDAHKCLKDKLSNSSNIQILNGIDSLAETASFEKVDIVVSAITGAAGLSTAIEAIENKKTLAIANKEVLVMAGEIVMPLAKKNGVMILPIDSEHSAIFQSLRAGNANEISKIILTASGGPFYDLPKEKLSSVTRDQALKHPTWEMGKKITIDSATLMNKALEIIEAKWLFDLDVSQIEVVVHPQSIIHSMVEFCDGSVIAQMGLPDMRTPIQFAITYPERKPVNVSRLDLTKVENLVFKSPDTDKFPSLTLGYEAAKIGGTMGSTLNAANEVAVDAFLNNQIKFTDITKLVKMAMMNHTVINNPTLDDVIASDSWARQEVYKCIS
ncbi:MAG: 1-deoxy-D-xylulose-5-phosphate reductoisomerase [Candidatus Anammoxibacter sp.]